MNNILKQVNSATEKIEKFVVGTSILLMMINSNATAIGRLFGKSLYFSEELNRFLIVAITFVGFAYAVRKGRNIRMTAIYDSLSQKKKKVLITFISLSTALLMFFLTYKAVLYVIEVQQVNRLSSALQFPVYIIYSIIPLGLGMAGIQYFIAFIMNITQKDIYLSYEIKDSELEQSCDL